VTETGLCEPNIACQTEVGGKAAGGAKFKGFRALPIASTISKPSTADPMKIFGFMSDASF
jgi:hypothetical protein